jgi:hypothetical protein
MTASQPAVGISIGDMGKLVNFRGVCTSLSSLPLALD